MVKRSLAVLASCVALLSAADLYAQGAAGPETQAIEKFNKGKKLLDQKKPAEALEELRESNKLLPSPNTQFLIGNALLDLGRPAEAMEAYEAAAKSAAERIAAGEGRFSTTKEEATKSGDELRPKLSKLTITVDGAGEGTKVIVASKEQSVTATGSKVTVSLWVEPGNVSVEVSAPDRASVSKTVEAKGGAPSTLSIQLEAPKGGKPVDPDPKPEPETPSGGGIKPPPIASWVTAGVGVVGFALFGTFLGLSEATWSDLQECSPTCGPDKREDADQASTFQIVGYASLGVGAAGIITAAILWIALPGPDAQNKPAAAVTFHFSPWGGGVSGTF